jgi:hypothetical protein
MLMTISTRDLFFTEDGKADKRRIRIFFYALLAAGLFARIMFLHSTRIPHDGKTWLFNFTSVLMEVLIFTLIAVIVYRIIDNDSAAIFVAAIGYAVAVKLAFTVVFPYFRHYTYVLHPVDIYQPFLWGSLLLLGLKIFLLKLKRAWLAFLSAYFSAVFGAALIYAIISATTSRGRSLHLSPGDFVTAVIRVLPMAVIFSVIMLTAVPGGKEQLKTSIKSFLAWLKSLIPEAPPNTMPEEKEFMEMAEQAAPKVQPAPAPVQTAPPPPPLPLDNLDELKKAADTVDMRKGVRFACFLTILFNMVVISQGIALKGTSPYYHPAGQAQFVIGVAVLLFVLPFLIKPAPSGFIVNGIMIIVIAAQNALMSPSSLPEGSMVYVWKPSISVALVIFGIKIIMAYKKHSHLTGMKVSTPYRQKIKEMVSRLKYATENDYEDVIRFTVKKRFGRDLEIKAKLAPGAALFSIRNNVVFETVSNIFITPAGLAIKLDPDDARLAIGDRKVIEGEISQLSWKRYNEWKDG